MATKMQVEAVIEKLEQADPYDFFRYFDETRAGIRAVLQFLYQSNNTVTAGMISDALGISTARVAVLLKKMVSKGLVSKERSPIDARITIVKLTEFGKETIEDIQNKMYQHMAMVIDTIGEERLMEFISIAKDLQNVGQIPDFNF
ncbi:MAG: MarR family winged helix-turn-helix transcriptional regulator [Eubacteriales bacterium]|nr:MarR family winged helix-turn-helix transcriptional regulator [Eubacteriales bacterium]